MPRRPRMTGPNDWRGDHCCRRPRQRVGRQHGRRQRARRGIPLAAVGQEHRLFQDLVRLEREARHAVGQRHLGDRPVEELLPLLHPQLQRDVPRRRATTRPDRFDPGVQGNQDHLRLLPDRMGRQDDLRHRFQGRARSCARDAAFAAVRGRQRVAPDAQVRQRQSCRARSVERRAADRRGAVQERDGAPPCTPPGEPTVATSVTGWS